MPTDPLICEAISELRTLLDVLRWGMSQFNQANLHFGHGTDNAWDEALMLALSALHLDDTIKPKCLHARLTKTERQSIIDLYRQRIEKRIPAAYLTHHMRFAHLDFYVDERVLIPRSPIAELIENHFSPWIAEEQVRRVLDIGTGSGCIAIACSYAFPEAEIDAVDISEDALAVARINVDQLQGDDRIHLIHSDLFAALEGNKYDIIVSNPPYVSPEEMSTLPEEYYHEPEKALRVSDQGLVIVIKILKQAKEYLNEEGILIVEVGNSQDALCERFPEIPFTWLEFERGGEGVFLLTAEQLNAIN